MNQDTWGEIINGNQTFQILAKKLSEGQTVGIGWTDEKETHLDIIFKCGLDTKCGDFQRGIRQDYLFVSIIDYTSYAFVPDDIKLGTYIQEKLRMNNSCGDKLKELINGVIKELNNI